MFLKYFFKDIYTTTYSYTNQKEKYVVEVYDNVKILQNNKKEKPLVKTKGNNIIHIDFKNKKKL